jgi:hypothetical protein
MSSTTQASFWTPKRTETYEHPNRLSKSEAKKKKGISEDEKKAVIIIQTQMEYWLTDVATNHQVTNQQPNVYKELINKSEDKVRGYNNTVNKYMSSEMEENFISQSQFTVILTMDTSQSNRRRGTKSSIDTTIMDWNGYKDYQSTKWQETQKCGSNEASISNLTPWKVWYQEFETLTYQPTTAIGENQNQW